MEEDLGRSLRGEPIWARPVGSIERAGKWVRRHPARTVASLAGLTISAAMLVVGWWLVTTRSLVRNAVETDLLTAKQALLRSDWGGARSALERARGRLGPSDRGELGRRLDRAGRDLELVGQLAAIRMKRMTQYKDGAARRAVAYEEAFRGAGLLDAGESPGVAADRLGRSDVKDALVVALDDRCLCAIYIAEARPEEFTRDTTWSPEARRGREAWLLDLARRADPDRRGWRDRFRDPLVRRDKVELARLAASAEIAVTPVHLPVILGELLQRAGGDATPFLLAVQRERPGDLWVNYFLANHAPMRDDRPEALRNGQAALAARPDSASLHHMVAEAFHRVGRLPESIAYYERGVRPEPDDAVMRLNLGHRLLETGRRVEAVQHFEHGLALAREAPDRLELRRV